MDERPAARPGFLSSWCRRWGPVLVIDRREESSSRIWSLHVAEDSFCNAPLSVRDFRFVFNEWQWRTSIPSPCESRNRFPCRARRVPFGSSIMTLISRGMSCS